MVGGKQDKARRNNNNSGRDQLAEVLSKEQKEQSCRQDYGKQNAKHNPPIVNVSAENPVIARRRRLSFADVHGSPPAVLSK